jgi:hypothetical protein
MKIKLPLCYPEFDDDRITEDMKHDLECNCELYVFKDEEAWKDGITHHAFNIFIDYGLKPRNSLMFETGLDDLEMFAHSILKSVEMLRRDYADVLKEKIKKGDRRL